MEAGTIREVEVRVHTLGSDGVLEIVLGKAFWSGRRTG